MAVTPGSSAALALVVLMVGATAAGSASLDISDGMEAEIERLIENAMRDLEVGWLDTVMAHGNVSEAGLETVDLMVRADGSHDHIELDPVTVMDAQGRTLAVSYEATRDEDGSLEEGLLGSDDLARLTIELAEPVETDRLELVFHHPDTAPLEVHLGQPTHASHGLVRLDIQRDW